MTTKSPGNRLEGSAGASYGSYNAQTYTASVTAPLIQDKLSLSIAGYNDSRDGFLYNKSLGSHPDSQFGLGGRVHLL